MNKLIGIFLKNDEEVGIFRRMAAENFHVYRKQYAIAIVCLLIIVVGSFAGEWLGVNQWFVSATANFWFGHQGYEYMDLGRFWQIFLGIGLILWVIMVSRHIIFAIRKNDASKHLLIILLISVMAIGMFFFSGLMYGENSSLPVINYWRWWLVHLWVEGFFEVFATVVIAYIFSQMKIISAKQLVVFRWRLPLYF